MMPSLDSLESLERRVQQAVMQTQSTRGLPHFSTPCSAPMSASYAVPSLDEQTLLPAQGQTSFPALGNALQAGGEADLPDLLTARTQAHLAIYRHAYRARLCQALRTNYELLPRLIGDEAFDELALAYVETFPSRHSSLRWFGHQLADFLTQYPQHQMHPAVLDFVRLEWALNLAFDAPDVPALGSDSLASVPPEEWHELRFALHPSAQQLRLKWTVGDVWRALKEGQDQVPEPLADDVNLLVWRSGLRPHWRSLNPLQNQMIASIARGASLGTVCEEMAQLSSEQDAPLHVVTELKTLLADGALVFAESNQTASSHGTSLVEPC